MSRRGGRSTYGSLVSDDKIHKKKRKKEREASQLRREIQDVERQERELRDEHRSLHQQIADRERHEAVKQERARADLVDRPRQALPRIEEGHRPATVLLKEEELEYL